MSVVQFLDERLNAPIDARDVVNTRNVLISRELTLLEAESYVRATVHPNRTTTNLSNRYNAADVTLFNNPTEIGSIVESTIFNLIKETRIDTIHPPTTTIRVRVEARNTTTTLVGVIQFRLNGIAVSGEIPITNAFAWYSFDIPNVKINDLLQVWGRVTTIAGHSVRARNFEIRGNTIAILSLIEAVHIRTVGLTTPLSATSLL